MNITVTVIDGVSGHPAEGVEVTVVGRFAGEATRRVSGLTDSRGHFMYLPAAEWPSRGQYSVELDVDTYFASLGILAGYKQVATLVRVINTQTDFQIRTLITPFAHATWSGQ